MLSRLQELIQQPVLIPVPPIQASSPNPPAPAAQTPALSLLKLASSEMFHLAQAILPVPTLLIAASLAMCLRTLAIFQVMLLLK